MTVTMQLVRELREVPGQPATSEVVGVITSRDSAFRDELTELLQQHFARQEAKLELLFAKLETTLLSSRRELSRESVRRGNG